MVSVDDKVPALPMFECHSDAVLVRPPGIEWHVSARSTHTNRIAPGVATIQSHPDSQQEAAAGRVFRVLL